MRGVLFAPQQTAGAGVPLPPLVGGGALTYGAVMAKMLLTAAALAALLAGCVDYTGARLVRYTDDEFYFRHFPIWLSDPEAYALAEGLCAEQDKEARQERDFQVYDFGLRYVTFECVEPGAVDETAAR